MGNTTAATGKGFAIARAALTALALFAAFVGMAGIDRIDIYKANVLAGLFRRRYDSVYLLSLVYSGGRQSGDGYGPGSPTADSRYSGHHGIQGQAGIRKVRSYLDQGIDQGNDDARSDALITPVIVGFTFGPEVLGGLLAGVTVSGVLMGIFHPTPAERGIMPRSRSNRASLSTKRCSTKGPKPTKPR